VADSITALRDGATVASQDCTAGKISEDTVIRHLVGREMADRYPRRTPNIGDKVFEVKNRKVHPERVVIMGVPACEPRRDCRHCRTDGRGPHRTGHEHFRSNLWPRHYLKCLEGRFGHKKPAFNVK
jgi:hypothetical protein